MPTKEQNVTWSVWDWILDLFRREIFIGWFLNEYLREMQKFQMTGNLVLIEMCLFIERVIGSTNIKYYLFEIYKLSLSRKEFLRKSKIAQ